VKRRDFLKLTTAVAAAGFPAIVRAQSSRPATPCGVAAGDVANGRALVWSRTDRPARMFVEYATTERFTDAQRVRGPIAFEGNDFTARTVLTGLPDEQRVFYRVQFEDLADLKTLSEPVGGSFTTHGTRARPVSVAWSADTVGQGWGINRDWGGLRLYDTMRQAQPDVFMNLGDTIYADQPLVAEVSLDDGSVWKNVVTEAKSRVAQSLDDYRGCYRYNYLDEHMRRFNAEVPQVVMWDDHEVLDNWYWERRKDDDARYQEKSVAVLAARARQAFFEYNPLPLVIERGDDPERVYRSIALGPLVELFALDMRTYKGANSGNRQTSLGPASAIFGPAQLAWLKRSLRDSKAVWKIVAADLPLGLIVGDGPGKYEAVANGDAGAPLGRELELADLLADLKRNTVVNVVWITADVHYCAAHHYDPARAQFTEFTPFWEFVAGPLNAGTFGPNVLDPTFGPEVRFTGIPPGMKPNRPPSDGFQFFGLMAADPQTRALTVQLRDLAGKTLYKIDLHPA
jgi:alkaline phosphatase D